MLFSKLATGVLFSIVGAQKLIEHDKLAASGLRNLEQYIKRNGVPSPGTCTMYNVAVRKEWSMLSKAERRNYIEAIQCIHSKPALTPAAVASGAKSRYDDFVVTHVLQTYSVHGTANFLTWHRYYIWAYEQLLRDECGYKGYLPYYNWAWWYENPGKSPLFDGSDTSISNGGTFVPGRNSTCIPSVEAGCPIVLPPGEGGGCVTGPLANWTVSLGPIQTHAEGIKPNPQADGLGYNPRCLNRDVSKEAAYSSRDEVITALIEDSNDVLTFQNRMQGDFANGYLGVHSAGHYTINGDAGSDFFNSPSDPAFYFHHAQVDRTFWIWQNQDIENRKDQVMGTITFLDQPPSRNGTVDDVLTLGPMFRDTFADITIADALSTVGGPFCYVYE
ncbi:Di-copper centre-containing protein [Decorospora gaudefroyi]|uniref:Di-copper centre-containing protein n=1 Tax=Decorospora gaudefroyi TaxID=184978 RepID=A0A6A5KNT6_9PLEO|nr:Di-copper centre-containing protein [Decorospora gaudefroyi]